MFKHCEPRSLLDSNPGLVGILEEGAFIKQQTSTILAAYLYIKMNPFYPMVLSR